MTAARRFQRPEAVELYYDCRDQPDVWRVLLVCGHLVDQPAKQPVGADGRVARHLVILPSLRPRRCYRCVPLPKRSRKAAS